VLYLQLQRAFAMQALLFPCQSTHVINAVQVNQSVIYTGRQQGAPCATSPRSDAICFTFGSPRSPLSSRDSVNSSPIAAMHEELDAVRQERDDLQAENTALLSRCAESTADINDLQAQLVAILAREAEAVRCAEATAQRLTMVEMVLHARITELANQEAAALQRAEATEDKLAKLVEEYNDVAVVCCPADISPKPHAMFARRLHRKLPL
jgi:septal ring factor EnvC (AmiA/AmiB activator)